MAQPSPREPGLGGVPTGRLRGTCVGTMPGATSCRLCRGRVRILRGSLTRFRMCVTERILMAAPLLPPTAGLAAGSARPHHGGPHPPITLLSCWSPAAVLGALWRRPPLPDDRIARSWSATSLRVAGRALRFLPSRVDAPDQLRPAVAGQPDDAVADVALELAAAAMLLEEGLERRAVRSCASTDCPMDAL